MAVPLKMGGSAIKEENKNFPDATAKAPTAIKLKGGGVGLNGTAIKRTLFLRLSWQALNELLDNFKKFTMDFDGMLSIKNACKTALYLDNLHIYLKTNRNLL